MRSLLICFLFLCSCSNGQKEALVKKDISLVSFSAQNQLDKTDNSMAWIDTQGIVEYEIHWGWKCSNQGDKSFVWLSQKNISGLKNGIINVSEEKC